MLWSRDRVLRGKMVVVEVNMVDVGANEGHGDKWGVQRGEVSHKGVNLGCAGANVGCEGGSMACRTQRRSFKGVLVWITEYLGFLPSSSPTQFLSPLPREPTAAH